MIEAHRGTGAPLRGHPAGIKERPCIDTLMGECFLCQGQNETRKVYMGSARGFADLCIDCVIKFYKIKTE